MLVAHVLNLRCKLFDVFEPAGVLVPAGYPTLIQFML